MHATHLIRAALLACLIAPAAPALAGSSNVELLHKYVGTWKGKGALSGAEEGTVVCRMTLKPSGEKVAFTGRCSMSGGNSSFRGMLAYNEAKQRFEAVSSESGTVVGKKSGGGIVFHMQDSNRQGTVTSTMALTGGAIKVDFSIVDAKTQDVTKARIPFSKT